MAAMKITLLFLTALTCSTQTGVEEVISASKPCPAQYDPLCAGDSKGNHYKFRNHCEYEECKSNLFHDLEIISFVRCIFKAIYECPIPQQIQVKLPDDETIFNPQLTPNYDDYLYPKTQKYLVDKDTTPNYEEYLYPTVQNYLNQDSD